MTQEYQIPDMVEKIEILKSTAKNLKRISGRIPAVERNADRILACIRLLELNISDISGIFEVNDQKPVNFVGSNKVLI